MRSNLVQCLAFIACVAGALVLGQAVPPGWGFAFLLVGSFAWLHHAHSTGQRWLQAQQWVFVVTSVIGLWNWWLGPLVLG